MTAALLAFTAAALACAGLGELAAARPRRGRGRRGAAAALACAGVGELAAARLRRGRGNAAPALVRVLAAAGGRLRPLARAGAPADLARRIEAAGRPGGLGVRELMAAKAAGAVAWGTWSVAVAPAAPGRLGVVLLAAGPLAGFLLPDLWLGRLAAARARRARRELAALLDLLAVTVSAGMSPAAGLGAVGERADGPVALAWRACAREVELGVPLADALGGMAERLPLPEIEQLAGTIARSARHGTPLAQALAAQARDVRLAERRRLQEEAARAGPKIQLVVALLLVPSVLLLVAAALVAALLGDGGLPLA